MRLYNLDFPEEDFQNADKLVRAAILARGRVQNWNSLRKVTTVSRDVPTKHRHRIDEGLNSPTEVLHAITLVCPHNEYEFDLWINPVVVHPTKGNFRATILHELCHGYLGVARGHDSSWRRLYARVLFHYHTQVYAIDHYESLVTLANWSYTKRTKSETTSHFVKRIDLDKKIWLDEAKTEAQQVADIYARMK